MASSRARGRWRRVDSRRRSTPKEGDRLVPRDRRLPGARGAISPLGARCEATAIASSTFSCAVSVPSNPKCWNTNPIVEPRNAASASPLSAATSTPPTSSVPACSCSRPPSSAASALPSTGASGDRNPLACFKLEVQALEHLDVSLVPPLVDVAELVRGNCDSVAAVAIRAPYRRLPATGHRSGLQPLPRDPRGASGDADEDGAGVVPVDDVASPSSRAERSERHVAPSRGASP